jgi:hypothetical protein
MSETSSAGVSGRRSRAEGARLVSEFEQSGMTRLMFCRGRGITPHMLDYYRRKLGNQKQPGATQLLPVELVGPLPARSSHLRVELANGRRIAVEDGFDALLLRRLLAVLEG